MQPSFRVVAGAFGLELQRRPHHLRPRTVQLFRDYPQPQSGDLAAPEVVAVNA
ncbi:MULTISPECIES: hypothetical protein [unclassified Streptomyces]|uniref:hypothetical protein n=1 Tax=unclassified Streptomyces TaxID=2593676 RepID=UPI002DD964FD|nr:hypothetical protein [Streptomyces sp. NBC_01750]WSA98398.1 hypothetical protein OIE54_03505 [Streptomyces sp. NBC_01794]WSD37066.1 hypothetical protein OG966_37285 [Streptomyces sp. NBC_01750]